MGRRTTPQRVVERAEIAYFETSLFNLKADDSPNGAALGVLAHEAKHIIGDFNHADGGLGSNPIWLDEGAADIS